MLIFLIIALSTWRISSLIHREDGPFDMFGRFRNYWYEGHVPYEWIRHFMVGIIDCMWCSSIWVGFFFAWIVTYFGFVDSALFFPYAFAASAGAILIEDIHAALTRG